MNSTDLIKKQIICEICERIVENPVKLPCENSICQKHTLNEERLCCKICKIVHEIPPSGFPLDKIKKEFVDANKPIILRNQSVKPLSLIGEIEKELSHYKSDIDEIKKIEEHFEKILSQINLRHQVLEQELNNIQQDLKNQLEIRKSDCLEAANGRKRKLNDSETDEFIEIKKKVKSYKEDLTALKIQEHEMDFIYNTLNDCLIQVKKRNQQKENESLFDKKVDYVSSNIKLNSRHFGKFLDKNLDLERQTFPKSSHIKYNAYLASGCYDGKIYIWDLDERKLHKQLEGHSEQISSLECFNGRLLVSASFDQRIRIWDVVMGHVIKSFETKSSPKCLKYLSNGIMAYGLENDNIKTLKFDGKEIKEYMEFQGHLRTTNALIKLKNGDLASGSTDQIIKIWDCKTKTIKQNLPGHDHCVLSLAQLSNDDLLASGSADETIKIWNLKDGTLKKKLKDTSGVCALVSLPNGDLASASREHKIKIWDLEKGEIKQELIGHRAFIKSLVLLPNGDLASGSKDRLIKVWDVNAGTERFSLRGNSDSVMALKVIPKP